MKYLSIYRPTSGEEGGMPSPEHMAAMGKLVEEMMRSGALVGTEPLAPREACVTVTLANGQFTVTGVGDRAGGYAILNANSKDEIIEMSKQFLRVAGEGTCEVRQVLEFTPPPV